MLKCGVVEMGRGYTERAGTNSRVKCKRERAKKYIYIHIVRKGGSLKRLSLKFYVCIKFESLCVCVCDKERVVLP